MDDLFHYKVSKSTTGEQNLAVSSSSVAFATDYEANEVDCCLVSNGANPIRVRFGGDPTASIGHYLPAGYSAIWSVQMANNAKFIAVSTASTAYATPLSLRSFRT